MAGMNIPYVLLQRYVSLLGNQVYYTQAMPVSSFSGTTLDVWVGAFIGTGSPYASFALQESNDGENFVLCAGTLPDVSIGSTATLPMEVQLSAQLTRAWLRLSVTVVGTNPGVTCWASGFLERREK